MIQFENHEYMNPSESKILEYERLKAEEVVHKFGHHEIRKSLFMDYPIEIRHWLSLFPQNYLDVAILSEKEIHRCISEKFNSLLASEDSKERDVLRFLKEEHHYLLISSLLKKYYSFGHHDAYIFPEFQIGNSYVADYLLAGKNSDGWHFVFVELESPKGSITTSDGEFGQVLRKGLKQTEDWAEWIEKGFASLVESFGKHKRHDATLPEEFRSLDITRIHYMIVAGRRLDFTDRTYRMRRKLEQERNTRVLHYDNLIDSLLGISGENTY